MANVGFNNFKNMLWGGNTANFAAVDFDLNTIKATLVDHGVDTPAPTTDEDIADITAGARIATATLGTITIGVVANGTLDAADTVFSLVSGASVESFIVWKDTGVEATSPLCLFFDTATGLPVTPNGGDITIQWNASGIADI